MRISQAACNERREAEMPESQAKAIASHLPDWSQFATKEDLARLEGRVAQRLSGLESRIIRWMVGISWP